MLVRELMTACPATVSPHAVTVCPETDLATVVELATSTDLETIPVVDAENRVLGVISRRDAVRTLARSDDHVERDVNAFLRSTGLREWLGEVCDGVVDLTGPRDGRQRMIARLLTHSIPGVVEVRAS